MLRAAVAALLVVLAAAAARAESHPGERIFQRCYACHSIVAGEDKLPGPNLRTIIGRRAGTLAGFEFSEAMINAGRRGLVWTGPLLDAFIADPERVVPGTSMTAHLADAEARRDLVEYLAAPR